MGRRLLTRTANRKTTNEILCWTLRDDSRRPSGRWPPCRQRRKLTIARKSAPFWRALIPTST